LRSAAIARLQELERQHGVRSVAFEILGPPRLSKLLYESFVLSRLRTSVADLAVSDVAALASDAAGLFERDVALRTSIVSIGLPIIVAGNGVYRGESVIVPPRGSDVEHAVVNGWVDLRPANLAAWIKRAQRMLEHAARRDRGSDSGVEWGAPEPEDPITPPQFTTWVFRHEDGGERIKR